MPDPTNAQITRTLAEKVMEWPVIDDDEPLWRHADKGGVVTSCGASVIRTGIIPQSWSPPTNRDDLAEVLAKLTPEQWSKVHATLPKIGWFADDARWLLTCDPAIIARAVAEVVSNKENHNENKDSRDSCLEDAD